jgi:hypothetical protein
LDFPVELAVQFVEVKFDEHMYKFNSVNISYLPVTCDQFCPVLIADIVRFATS